MSQAGVISIDGGSGPVVQTIQVDDGGSVTGQVIQLYAEKGDGSANAGSTVEFIAATATEIDLVVTDASNNTIIGNNAGNNPEAGQGENNTGLGFFALGSINGASSLTAVGVSALTSATTDSNSVAVGYQALLVQAAASNNTAVGSQAMSNIITGSNNIAVGLQAGNSYTGAESNNIVIGHTGIVGTSSEIHIGTQGTQTTCIIAGITTVNPANQKVVVINSSTGLLGVQSAGVPLIEKYTATAISYQVLVTDAIIGVTSTAAARTITMPNTGLVAGQRWTIKDESGGALLHNITVSGNGANIDGAATFVISTNYGSVDIYCNGTNFFLI